MVVVTWEPLSDQAFSSVLGDGQRRWRHLGAGRRGEEFYTAGSWQGGGPRTSRPGGLTALSIARERELGTLEQLVMTPIRSSELLLGKLLPFGLVGLLDAAVVTGVVVGFLRVPLRGSLPTLFAATILFLFAVLGLGLLVSTVSANQQQAQLTNFFLIFPSILLSGFIFPVDNLPSWMAPLSKVVPMTYYLEVVRGVFLRGTGVARLGWELGSLAVLAAVFFTAGAVRFRKRLD